MAEPLKNQFGPDIPASIAKDIAKVYPGFRKKAFVRDVLEGFEPLALKQRAKRIADALARHLPENYGEAVEILIASLGPRLEGYDGFGMTPFRYLPHTLFVAERGLDHFDLSMKAQYELTQRFTAEFSIRPFLEKHPKATLSRLREWTADPSPHVRRLVSEGTRPRLPWAQQLAAFRRDPKPVLALLERLKDDSELYVRRSVANNLNDIGKDHPQRLYETAARWMKNASPEREWLVRHALRSAIKRGEDEALAILGFGEIADVAVETPSISPARAKRGGSVLIAFTLANQSRSAQRLLVDFRIHYVKKNGTSRPKVFKMRSMALAPGESISLQKRVSLADMTTRKHYAGRHRVDLLINGELRPLGAFELLGSG